MTSYYDHAGVRLYHGDCREVLPALTDQAALLLTDPPYGIGFVSHYRRATPRFAVIAGDQTVDGA